ncbi:MAG: hydrogenase expression/formation protein HypE [Bellilinea sp.]|nr:MAG: hydrogenase expression/formation protein HypE [Bellilinea sp.]
MADNSFPTMEGPFCPLPLKHDEQIILGHGSGGRLTHNLIKEIFLPYLSSPALQSGDDFARLTEASGELIVSTDCHIVSPLFFPGGDIGRLAVCGTVNDIAVSGAQPLYLTTGFILEEGLPVQTLVRILESMRLAAQEAGVQFVAGDTKVVEKGKADGLFITTTGIGFLPKGRIINGHQAQPGDVILVSGSIGDHGIAVLAERGELGFSAKIQSDVAPLNGLIQDLLTAAPHTHVLRDPTRGGLATTLNEIAAQSQVGMILYENKIPINPAVQAACEMLGFDPLYIANEGKIIAIVPPQEAEAALNAMHHHPYGKLASRIGEVTRNEPGRVLLKTNIGATRILDMLAGEILPRIC